MTGFRLSARETSAIMFYRVRMHMSISHIATLIERSTRTVAKAVSKNCYAHKLFDKRKWCPHARLWGERIFTHTLGKLSWFYECWKDGLIWNIALLSGKAPEGEPP